jgi:hypothetical protein
VIILAPAGSWAVQIYDAFPDVIHANERYVIYSHGFIAEGTDPTPISPKYGIYNFPAIKREVFFTDSYDVLQLGTAGS